MENFYDGTNKIRSKHTLHLIVNGVIHTSFQRFITVIPKVPIYMLYYVKILEY
jgi:hypothetical protein